MLLTHLGKEAQEKVIGLEGDYNGALAALDKNYNKRSKIRDASMKDIRHLHHSAMGSYKALVSYCTCIVNNHVRLSARGLEQEVSNVGTLRWLRWCPICRGHK